jgi:hypothetical protein
MIDQFKNELINKPVSYICSKWLLDRTPYIFNEDSHRHIEWKELLSSKINVDSKSLIFLGSSSCGFSLNPNKNYRTFNDKSDIDIAVVSGLYFDISWKTLRNLGTKRYTLNRIQKNSLDDHVNRLIYWGTIATDQILELLPFGKDWSLELIEMSKLDPINKKTINIRLYKDFESLRAYQVNNLKSLKTELHKNL